MKKLEFETSKGRFVVVDGVGEDFAMDLTHMIICDEWFVKLSNITEEQASEVVGVEINMNHSANHNIMQLHSLLKSKGVYLFENPLKDSELSFIGNVSGIDMLLAKQKHDRRIKEAEQKTFYNPYIFKL